MSGADGGVQKEEEEEEEEEECSGREEQWGGRGVCIAEEDGGREGQTKKKIQIPT